MKIWFDTVTYIELVDLRIQTENKIIQIFFQKIKLLLHQLEYLFYG